MKKCPPRTRRFGGLGQKTKQSWTRDLPTSILGTCRWIHFVGASMVRLQAYNRKRMLLKALEYLLLKTMERPPLHIINLFYTYSEKFLQNLVEWIWCEWTALVNLMTVQVGLCVLSAAVKQTRSFIARYLYDKVDIHCLYITAYKHLQIFTCTCLSGWIKSLSSMPNANG